MQKHFKTSLSIITYIKSKTPHLAQGTVFGKITTDCFPIHFTGGEVNKTLIVLRTVLHLKARETHIVQVFNKKQINIWPIYQMQTSQKTTVTKYKTEQLHTTGRASMKLLQIVSRGRVLQSAGVQIAARFIVCTRRYVEVQHKKNQHPAVNKLHNQYE